MLSVAQNATVLDAVRLSDGMRIVLRVASTWSDEVPILRRLNRLSNDSRNHAVPVLDAIPLPDNDEQVIIVLPLLRDYYDPPFSQLDQVVQALTQFFEVRLLWTKGQELTQPSTDNATIARK